MDSIEWLGTVTNGTAPTTAARAAGIQASTMASQVAKGVLAPKTVVAIARKYDAPILEGLVAAGLITADEAQIHERGGLLVHEARDEDLLHELLRRVDVDGDLSHPAIMAPVDGSKLSPWEVALVHANLAHDAWNIVVTLLSGMESTGGHVELARVQDGASPSAWWDEKSDTLYATLSDDPWTARVVIAEALARRERDRAVSITPTAYACARVTAGSARDEDVARVLGVAPAAVEAFREEHPALALGAE